MSLHGIRDAAREAGVTSEQFEPFMQWSFGEDYGSLSFSQAPERWNERHSDLFEVFGSDEVYATYRKMAAAYLDHMRAQS